MKRLTVGDNIPFMASTKDFAAMFGFTNTYIARLCRKGDIPAAKVGKSWHINTIEALQIMGLLNDKETIRD